MSICLSAHNDDTEPSRIERLARVVLAIHRSSPSTLIEIERLHDHKGTLSVTWTIEPQSSLRRHVEAAWSDENEYFVEHIDGSGPSRAFLAAEVRRNVKPITDDDLKRWFEPR